MERSTAKQIREERRCREEESREKSAAVAGAGGQWVL